MMLYFVDEMLPDSEELKLGKKPGAIVEIDAGFIGKNKKAVGVN